MSEQNIEYELRLRVNRSGYGVWGHAPPCPCPLMKPAYFKLCVCKNAETKGGTSTNTKVHVFMLRNGNGSL
jgi:hypothetical protein